MSEKIDIENIDTRKNLRKPHKTIEKAQKTLEKNRQTLEKP